MLFKRINIWSQQSVTRRIFAALLTVGGITVLVNFVTVVRELVVASVFGTGNAFDAFIVAYMLPLFMVNVFVGSLNTAFIPTFIQIREEQGLKAAQQLFSNTMVLILTFLIFTSLLLGLVIPYVLPFISSGFASEKLTLTSSLFWLLLPVLFISGLARIWSAVLNAGERFVLVAASPVLIPVTTIVILFYGTDALGIHALAIGMVSGAIIEAIGLAWILKRQGYSLWPRWQGLDAPLRQIIGQFSPMVAGAIIMSGTGLIDKSMAAMLAPGSVSALNYCQ